MCQPKLRLLKDSAFAVFGNIPISKLCLIIHNISTLISLLLFFIFLYFILFNVYNAANARVCASTIVWRHLGLDGRRERVCA